ncbi:hypothetical protein AVEN_125954-1 [Araneus ventricosus]|uniref:Uncharacterized protein n=1 Tax=Araneus ventricosus TaxID=182803 RepID=A0A4Y2GWK0_ARAVE|nr:hypothetical protein AVEN_125954-1 [Araneus ventricosus]
MTKATPKPAPPNQTSTAAGGCFIPTDCTNMADILGSNRSIAKAEIWYHYTIADYPVPNRQEGIDYRLYQIQKYQAKVSGTSTYRYQLVPDTAKPGINRTLVASQFWLVLF